MPRYRRVLSVLAVFLLSLALVAAVAWRGAGIPATAGTAAASPPGNVALSLQAAAASRQERAKRERALTDALDAYIADGRAEVGVTVIDNLTGQTYSYQGDEKFGTASIVKVQILATALLRGSLTPAQEDLAAKMIKSSDNDAASTLWWQIDDVAGITASSRTFGLTETVPGADGWWGLTSTTSADQARLVSLVTGAASPLGAVATGYIDSLMGDIDDDQDFGVSAAAHDGEHVLLKNGWMDDDDGTWTVNTVGRILGSGVDLTMVVLSSGTSTMDSGVELVEHVAELARAGLAE